MRGSTVVLMGTGVVEESFSNSLVVVSGTSCTKMACDVQKSSWMYVENDHNDHSEVVGWSLT